MNLYRPLDKVHKLSQGWMENPQNYPVTKGHMGLDWACPPGTPIYAAYEGIVTRAELDTQTASNPSTGYGNHIRIEHPNRYTSIYGHLSVMQVKTGQKVEAGQVIGLSGNTGYSTGPHLHFEVRTGASIQTCIDPSNMIIETLPPREPLFEAEITLEGNGLRVRANPNTKAKIVRNLQAGEKIKVMGLTGDVWLWLANDEGYVSFQPSWIKLLARKPIIIRKNKGSKQETK